MGNEKYKKFNIIYRMLKKITFQVLCTTLHIEIYFLIDISDSFV